MIKDNVKTLEEYLISMAQNQWQKFIKVLYYIYISGFVLICQLKGTEIMSYNLWLPIQGSSHSSCLEKYDELATIV